MDTREEDGEGEGQAKEEGGGGGGQREKKFEEGKENDARDSVGCCEGGEGGELRDEVGGGKA